MGPLLLARKHGQDAPNLVRVVAAALRFNPPGPNGAPDDPSAAHVQERLAALGVEGALRELCELGEREEDLLAEIVKAYKKT
jgi:hypothetical protein